MEPTETITPQQPIPAQTPHPGATEPSDGFGSDVVVGVDVFKGVQLSLFDGPCSSFPVRQTIGTIVLSRKSSGRLLVSSPLCEFCVGRDGDGDYYTPVLVETGQTQCMLVLQNSTLVIGTEVDSLIGIGNMERIVGVFRLYVPVFKLETYPTEVEPSKGRKMKSRILSTVFASVVYAATMNKGDKDE